MDPTLITQICLGILFLASFIIAYLASKTWLIRHVVLVWFVFFASAAFFFLAAKTMDIHAQWKKQVKDLDQQLTAKLASNKDLEFGAAGQVLLPEPGADLSNTGLRHLRHALHRLTIDRGPVWFDGEPTNVGPDGSARLSIQQPAPHGIEANVRLFVFEQDPNGQYLGEFEVTEAVDGSVAIRPVMDLADWELQRIAQSESFWTLYRTMPVDRHSLFTLMSEEDLRVTIPEASIDEYLRDGTPAVEGDPPERIVAYKADGTLATDDQQDQDTEYRYVRQLRDYGWLLSRFSQQRSLMEVEGAALDFDAARLQDALAKGEQNVAYREGEKAKLFEDREKFRFEQQVIADHLVRLEQQYANLQARLAVVLDQNVQRAAELTELEMEAVRQIDALTSKRL